MQAVQTLSNQTLGHYQLLQEAGRGGMSVVTEAVDTRTGQWVALKRLPLPPSLSREARKEMTSRKAWTFPLP